MIRGIIVSALLANSIGLAAAPLAKLTSPGPFQLSGQTVAGSTVPNWPLVEGDSVALGKKPARITFADGSVVFLTPRSRATITTVDGLTTLRLERGVAAYRFRRESAVRLAGGTLPPISQSSKEGRMLVNGSDALWNPVEPEFYLFGEGSTSPEQRNPEAAQIGMSPDNYNLDQIDAYQGYEPDWGTPPGQDGQGAVPPAAVTSPGQPNPASAFKP